MTKAKSAKKMYRCFTENNDWEGETWNFYIPIAGNEKAIAALEERLKLLENTDLEDVYEMNDEVWSADNIKVLQRARSSTTYMDAHNILKGKLNFSASVGIPTTDVLLKEMEPFYKGGIRDFMEVP